MSGKKEPNALLIYTSLMHATRVPSAARCPISKIESGAASVASVWASQNPHMVFPTPSLPFIIAGCWRRRHCICCDAVQKSSVSRLSRDHASRQANASLPLLAWAAMPMGAKILQ